MQKKILAIYYSQSGQLAEIIDNFCAPLIEAGATVEKVQVRLKNDYAFPWTTKRFFAVMPDCVLGVTTEVEPYELKSGAYDLIILGYQAWFLSPSVPFHSLMLTEPLKRVMANTPVITITGARNMWVNAFEKIKQLVRNNKGNHVGTVALVDRHPNLVSIFTIFHWMVGGKKTRYLNFFPLPGVSSEDISHTKVFGKTVIPHLEQNVWSGLREELIAQKAADPKFHLLFMESKASAMFRIWANAIAKRQKKDKLLAAFKYYLLIALFIFAPIVFLISLLFFRPFMPGYVRSKKDAVLKLN